MKEKSQIEKNAEERQTELLSTALNEASNAGGHWLNATGKGFPKFYPKGVAVSPFNGLFMALHLGQRRANFQNGKVVNHQLAQRLRCLIIGRVRFENQRFVVFDHLA